MNRNYLICQYRTKPKAMGTINAIYAETTATFENALHAATVLNIEKAKGYALDLVGRHVGMSRILNQAIVKEYFGFLKDETALAFNDGEFYRYGDALNSIVRLDDSDYRFFIKSKIKKNYQTGTIENIVDSVNFLFGLNSNVVDNQDMTMNIVINSKSLNSLLLYAVKYLDIIVRPIGVMYRYLILTSDQPFGFYKDSSSFGFDAGKFVRLQNVGIE
ncbi:MAG: hypothetical protein [Bacteriophage sp.]|nr:MAG: hypothetical protein [Bacteriophage sp.]